MKSRSLVWLAALTGAVLAFASAPHAQTKNSTGVILRGNQVNEAALINALDPNAGIRTRSLRVRPATESAEADGAPSGVASLLITFSTNSAEITPASRNTLDVVGRALNSDRLAQFRFAVEGHADPRGGHAYNLTLSEARAESVVDYLVRKHNVSRERLEPVGKGDYELANAAVPTAPENRRVTIRTETQ